MHKQESSALNITRFIMSIGIVFLYICSNVSFIRGTHSISADNSCIIYAIRRNGCTDVFLDFGISFL